MSTSNGPEPIPVRETYTLRKYDVDPVDGSRTLAETITLDYEHGQLVKKTLTPGTA